MPYALKFDIIPGRSWHTFAKTRNNLLILRDSNILLPREKGIPDIRERSWVKQSLALQLQPMHVLVVFPC
jgi:hypothetical protein